MEMTNLKTNDEIFLYASSLVNIPSVEIVHLLKVNHIYLPDYLHKFILRETVSKYVFDKKLYDTYTDEYKYRLRAYKNFSIYLLEKAITTYNLQPEDVEYKEIFFKVFLLNAKLYGVTNAFYAELEKLHQKFLKSKNKETFQETLANFQKIYYTPKGYLDGLCLSVIKESLVVSATLTDLHELGLKYNVDVPRRINKGKLLEIISARFQLKESEINELKKKSVLDLEIYAKNQGFKVSTDLKKSDMVEYIIYSLGKYHQSIEQDLHNYDINVFVPSEVVPDMEPITIEGSDQAIPISNQYIEKEIEKIVSEKEDEEDDYVPVEVVEDTKEEENIVQEELELVEDSVSDDEPVQETLVEEALVTVDSLEEEANEETKEIKQEIAEKNEHIQVVEEPQKQIEEKVVSYYDPAIDEEIQKIIKVYYKKRNRKLGIGITIIIIVLLAILVVLGYYGYKTFLA